MIPSFPNASEEFRKKNPDLFVDPKIAAASPPQQYQAPSKSDVKLEKQLQAQIRGFLERNGITVIQNRTDRATSNNVGTPDLLWAFKGKAIAWEVKLPGKRLTEEQEKMKAKLIADGWSYCTIYTYDEAVFIFQKISS